MSDCNKNKNCGCESGLTTPQPCVNIFNCEEEKCSETFDSKCIIYTNDDIICNTDEVVSQGDDVETALKKIIDYFCDKTSKIIEYKEVVEEVDFYDIEPIREYVYPNSQYANLIYTNTTGFTKTFKIFISYSIGSIFDTSMLTISAALFKKVGITETKLYEVNNEIPTPLPGAYIGSPDYRTESFFYLITLQNNESVTVKFKHGGGDNEMKIRQAQMMIEEV